MCDKIPKDSHEIASYLSFLTCQGNYKIIKIIYQKKGIVSDDMNRLLARNQSNKSKSFAQCPQSGGSLCRRP